MKHPAKAKIFFKTRQAVSSAKWRILANRYPIFITKFRSVVLADFILSQKFY